jgi:hypothetical protein
MHVSCSGSPHISLALVAKAGISIFLSSAKTNALRKEICEIS